jgi:hypothetical protein
MMDNVQKHNICTCFHWLQLYPLTKALATEYQYYTGILNQPLSQTCRKFTRDRVGGETACKIHHHRFLLVIIFSVQ